MTDKELLQEALDVMEDLGIKEAQIVSDAIKARLAQPEPAAWVELAMEQAQVFASAWSLVGSQFDSGDMLERAEEEMKTLRLMLNLRQRKPLTDEEIDKLFIAAISTGAVSQYDIRFARAIEAAHGIKE